jgi:F-type H+-transporting ATPase subunit b
LARPALADDPPAEAPAGEHGHEHGDHGHGDPAQEGAHGEHGHGHGGGGITNWFHFPSEEHPNGPFAFMILNFVILVYLLVRFAKKPFVQYLENRHTSIRDNLAEASKMREEAREKLDVIKGKLSNLEREIAEIKESVKKDAELEKQRIIADAQAQAEQLVLGAERTLEEEVRRARRMLEREAVSAAMTASEKMIRQKITDVDRKRINEDYFQQITSSGGSN